ncbi:MAG: type III pantothenate kinase [Vicinamibacterales bacterium]
MLLAIDVGNTNIVLGVFEGRELIRSWRLQTLRDRTADELGLAVDGLFAHGRIDRGRIGGIVLGSVVPPLTNTVVGMLWKYFERKPLVVDPPVNSGMPILYSNPGEVGADRIVNAIAAFEQYGGNGRPLIVCDFGTATTLDAVSANGEYLGGAICPGVTISADALFQRAARLPRIEVRKPATVIGRTTVGAMESGLFFGYVGMVEGLVRRMDAELGGNAVCVATGGLAVVIAPETHLIEHVDVELTLQGLRLVWERNQAKP